MQQSQLRTVQHVGAFGLFSGDAYVLHRSATLGARFGLVFGLHAVATVHTLVGVGGSE